MLLAPDNPVAKPFEAAIEAPQEAGAAIADGLEGSRATNEGGLLLTINGKTGWREVEIGRGSSLSPAPSPCWRLGYGSGASRTGRFFARSPAKTLASGPSG